MAGESTIVWSCKVREVIADRVDDRREVREGPPVAPDRR